MSLDFILLFIITILDNFILNKFELYYMFCIFIVLGSLELIVDKIVEKVRKKNESKIL